MIQNFEISKFKNELWVNMGSLAIITFKLIIEIYQNKILIEIKVCRKKKFNYWMNVFISYLWINFPRTRDSMIDYNLFTVKSIKLSIICFIN